MNSKLSRIAAPLLIATVMILIVPAMVARTAPDDQRQPSVSSLKAESNFDTPNHVPLSIKGGPSMQSTQAFTLTGWLTIIWGDGKPGSQQALEIYYLANDQNQTIRLLIDAETLQSAGGALALNGRRVTVVGTPHSPAAPGLASAAFQVQSIQLEQSSTAPLGNQANAAVIGSQPWISILCKFSDVTNEPKLLSYFQDMYRGSWPGLDHYWREQSYNLVNVLGSGAVGWYSLPQPRSYYVYDVNGDGQPDADLGRLFRDCTAVADTAVYFPNYVGINLMFNDMLGCCAWGGAFYTTLDGVTKAWRTTWEPPWGYSNITIMGHEMGHGLGLPHSSGHYGQTYDNQWDVMSDSWSNCSRLTDPVYGCIGQHTIAYHKDLLGWIAAGQRYEVAPGERVTITLEQLALPQSGNYLYIQVSIQGSSTWFYSIEARRNISQSNPTAGYDYKLPGSAIIIHEVETSRDRPANVIDIDGNGNTGDAGAMWLPGETFVDSVNRITITVKSTTPTGFVVSVDNQSFPIADLSVSQSDSPDPVKAGTRLTYTVTVANNGPSLATGVRLTDTLPSGVTFGAAWPSQGNCGGISILICDFGALVGSVNATVTVVVTPTVGGTITNTAIVAGDEADLKPINNTAVETTAVRFYIYLPVILR